MKKFIDRLTPPQILTFGFLMVIICGATILQLPIAHQAGVHVSFIDALFTAVSATAITGLTTLNTATTWSWFGQVVILIMIEIGALGFMTFTVLLLTITRQKIDLKARLLMQDALNLRNLADVKVMLSYVFSLSVIIQVIGAILLSFDFVPRFGWAHGLYYSVAHSISAFGNAGFIFFPQSVDSFQNSPYVLVVWMFLILAGSLGFLVWRDLMSLFNHKHHRLSLHTRIALSTSSWLILLGFVGFLITEKGLPHTGGNLFNRLIDTLFLAISPRTAGFAIVPMTSLSAGGLIIVMFLMFVGGTPGSTSGGIKTTTLGILWRQSIAALRGQERVNYGDRQISQANIIKALMLTVLSLAFVLGASLILAVTETIPHGFGVEYITFEVIAAFSTAGFSLGLTPHLTLIGKIVIMLVMFIGRVGLYTVMFSVLNIHQQSSHHRYPTEEIMIG
ncbi:trk system potassium uptake protein TrkH [Weissella uvarum]|uniref:TrkH family potassium uptake protein n=1 Tax=Weissella uvarum TaxID=1479233 RepID=UPI00195F6262|nr:potassium transporter TrkG [Weissella uvarum]MBM7616941.1 trk system potassium uptake protein TrkH [Weissella uvarum]MCM0594610.1 Trk family potassium uptake protein [Weissella uvarum]